MPVINRNQNSSNRPGRGLGPCGAGQARGRSMRGSEFNSNGRSQGFGSGRGMRRGMGQGQGREMGLGRRNGMCRFDMNQPGNPAQYERTLEDRIIELEAENQRLRAEAGK